MSQVKYITHKYVTITSVYVHVHVMETHITCFCNKSSNSLPHRYSDSRLKTYTIMVNVHNKKFTHPCGCI